MSIRSPLRYAGGKHYARKLIMDVIPPFHEHYCEPFVGGGSVFFAKIKTFGRNTINDFDSNVVLVFTVIRDQPDALIDFLRGKQATRENHTFYKNEFVPKDDIEKAGRWYFLNRISYSGIMNMANCYWGYGEKFSMIPDNWPRVIRAASQKLQGVEITNDDFETAIEQCSDGSFLFIDPPYYSADQDKFYTHSFKRDDHVRLAACLKRNASRCQFLLTYDSCPEVRDLYQWAARIDELEWIYTISRTDDQKKDGNTSSKGVRAKGKELFIRNYT